MTPTLAFDRELDLDLGGREVRILHLGRGNTAGDAVVYLPREKILAAGDLLDHPVPYLGGGYPRRAHRHARKQWRASTSTRSSPATARCFAARLISSR